MVPLYMQDVIIPNDIVSQRLQSQHLTKYHHEFRYHSQDEFLDSEVFINLMVLAFKEGRIPEQWRYVEFGKILLLKEKMKIKPIGAEEQSPMYNIVRDDDQRFDSARAAQDR